MSLSVPYLSQGDEGNLCVPLCLKMVLEYLATATGNTNLSALSVKQIARAVHTKPDGTDFEDVDDINLKLEKIVPSVEFEVNDKRYDFKAIESELARRTPVIAWLYLKDADGSGWHSVVVTGYDRINQRIMVNDPWRGQLSMTVGDFMREWHNQMLIRLKLGTRIQRRITEFTEQPESKEGIGIARE